VKFKLLLLLAALCWISFPSVATEQRVLVYQRNGPGLNGKGFVHDNLAASAAAIQELGKANDFGVEVSTNPAVFTDANLKQFKVLVFANSNNEAFDTADQKEAFQRFIKSGGGFVGIHSASGSERNWPYFQRVLGAKFLRHPPLQKFTIDVVDQKHPGTAHLGQTWEWSDECYFFTNMAPGLKVLLAVNVASEKSPKALHLDKGGDQISGRFPLAWCQEFDGGRQFYTSLGHKIEFYSDPVYRQHILGGILWAMNEKSAP
jgi:type 1 glutamine amidotransferase